MEELVYNATNKYFTHLENTGYFKQSEVIKLMALSIIQEMVDGDLKDYITKEDYNSIQKALYCLYGSSCLIPYPDYYSGLTDKILFTEVVHILETNEDSDEDLND